MDVDRVGVAGEVDDPPDLRDAEHWEKGGGVLEPGGDRPPVCYAFLTVRSRLDERDAGKQYVTNQGSRT